MAEIVQGYEDLSRKLALLASPKDQALTLKASVRTPMREVQKVAAQNLAAISPGERALHRTYKGRLVAAGFASRNLRVIASLSPDKQMAFALLGVRAEAYYVLQFFELGTAMIPRHPWLTPAFYQSREASVRRVGEVMLERIEKIAKSRGG